MRLAAKWQSTWSMALPVPEEGGRSRVRLGGGLGEGLRLGKGQPLVLVPGLAGSWRLLLPLARRLARRFEVITYGLRGDSFPSFSSGLPQTGVWDIGGHAENLASLFSQ